MAIRNMEEDGGTGHTAGIYSNDEDHILYFGEKIPVARVLVNQPTPDAWGPETNALSPAVSEGCGTWGNNILAGNVDYIHMVNVSKIVKKLDVEPVSYTHLEKLVDKYEMAYRRGLVSNKERYEKVIEIWNKTTDDVADALMDSLDSLNNLFIICLLYTSRCV